jgi:hypothetical protein
MTMSSIHLQPSAVAAIIDCPLPGQFIGFRSLKPVASQLIWLFQEFLPIATMLTPERESLIAMISRENIFGQAAFAARH